MDNLEDEIQPADAESHLQQAQYYYQEHRDLERALFECDAAIDIARSFLADAYNLRGIIMEEWEDAEAAMDAYKRAILVEPGFREAADNLRELEAELGMGYGMTTIRVFGQVSEAVMAQAQLDAEGIESLIADERTAGTFAFNATWLGGVRLQVKEADVEAAAEILQIELDDEDKDELTCPNCDSLNIQVPLLGKKWKCRDCKFEWEIED